MMGLLSMGFLFVLSGSGSLGQTAQFERWVEDCNRNMNAGYPLDFISRYEAENLPHWAESRSKMAVWQVTSAGIYNYCKTNSTFAASVGAVLNGTPTCLNTIAATWAHHLNYDLSHTTTINAITRMKSWGWNPQYIALQSVLSKPYPNDGWELSQVPERIADVVTFFQALKSKHPGIKIGIIDALPAHGEANKQDFEAIYQQLEEALNAEGYSLDFIQLDFPNCHPDNTSRTWEHLLRAENKAKALGWKTGWFMSAKTGGNVSADLYRYWLQKGLNDYLAYGGKPEIVLTGAFSEYPEYSIPDNVNTNSNPNGATQYGTFLLVDDKLNILPAPYQKIDVGSVAAIGKASYSNGIYTVHGSGAGIASSADRFRYVYGPTGGDASIVVRVTGVQNTGTAQAGIMFRESTNANSRHVSVFIQPNRIVRTRWRHATGSGTTGGDYFSAPSFPYWLKLTRTGNIFRAYHSANGTSWTQLNADITNDMPTAATMGLAVSSANDGVLCQSTFDNVTAEPFLRILPNPWVKQDIGAVGAIGNSIHDGYGTFAVSGAGQRGINLDFDQFHFMNQTSSGDCEIRIRVTGVENVGSISAQAAVVIRESMNANARTAAILIQPNRIIRTRWRASTGANTTEQTFTAPLFPYWLRLTRTGNTFRAYHSPDGTPGSWTQLGPDTTISMASTAHIGVGVSSRVSGVLSESVIDNVTVIP